MAIFNVTNVAKNALENNLTGAKDLLENRRELWRKLPLSKREAWKANCPDPVIGAMWKMHQHLKEFFGE